jgi:peroxiredoxin Q/BCP
MNPELQVGDEAPDFQAAEAKRGEVPSSFHLTGKRGDGRVALCFYPYDDVPAATEQLSALRDAWGRIDGKAALFGISRDTVENHHRIAERLGLPFSLLTDEDDRIAKAYGIWLGEGGGGDVEGGSLTERATFVIGRDGRIEAILRDEKAAEHVARLLDLLGA